MYLSLLKLDNQDDYKGIYESYYCNREIKTHDGYIVKFRPETFSHAFFCNADRRAGDKSLFSIERAERMLWIEKVLQDATLTLYAGWDSKNKRYDHSRRVTLLTPDGYVVVLRVSKDCFIFNTAYLIDNSTVLRRLQGSPLWNGEHTFA